MSIKRILFPFITTNAQNLLKYAKIIQFNLGLQQLIDESIYALKIQADKSVWGNG